MGTLHLLHHSAVLGKPLILGGCPGFLNTVYSIEVIWIVTSSIPIYFKNVISVFMLNRKNKNIPYIAPVQVNIHRVNGKSGPIVIQGSPLESLQAPHPFP